STVSGIEPAGRARSLQALRASRATVRRPLGRASDRSARGVARSRLCTAAHRELAGKDESVGGRRTKQLRGARGACARSLLPESPQWLCLADDRGERSRTEVTAIEGRGLVPVHEEDLVLRDRSTPLPDRQCAATPIVCERGAHLDAIDADGALVPAH